MKQKAKTAHFTIPPKPPKIRLMGYDGSIYESTQKKAPYPSPGSPRRKGRRHKNFSSDSDFDEYVGRVSLKAPHTQFAVIPSRAISDPRINTRKPLLLLLGAIGMHASAKGICYPSQYRIAMLCGKSRSWAGKYMRELLAMGYIRRLVPPTPKGKRAAWRIQVLWRGNDPLPSKESDWFTSPWCWTQHL
jgi:hypothetical protein